MKQTVRKLLQAAKGVSGAGPRMERISAELVGLPYRTNLIGSVDTPEVFVTALDEFDCVTFMETVLALAHSREVMDFPQALRLIRYAKGDVEWTSRNHYMTQWLRNNEKAGFVRRLRTPKPTVMKDRHLNVVPGLRPLRMKFEVVPKRDLLRAADSMETGDLIFFGSTRSHLDIFHCGMLLRRGGELTMRHASRSKGGVVDQKLADFLKNNRMSGVLLARPAELS